MMGWVKALISFWIVAYTYSILAFIDTVTLSKISHCDETILKFDIKKSNNTSVDLIAYISTHLTANSLWELVGLSPEKCNILWKNHMLYSITSKSREFYVFSLDFNMTEAIRVIYLSTLSLYSRYTVGILYSTSVKLSKKLHKYCRTVNLHV